LNRWEIAAVVLVAMLVLLVLYGAVELVLPDVPFLPAPPDR
jgi:hypothetical protein